jgi:aromatic ring-opening dioxygenase catalytic subunit (LigB family)
MGDVVKAYFVPNGSYLMEMAEDGDKVSAVETLQSIGREIREVLRPDAIVVASPHWLPKSAFFVDDSPHHESFNDYPLRPAPFGRRFFSYTAAGDPVLARAIIGAAQDAGVPASTKVYGFDHGAFCPLKVMDVSGIPTVPISTSRRSFDESVRWGEAVRRAAQSTGRRVVVISPGNLTHRLDLRGDDERESYLPLGAQFDKVMIDLVTSGRTLDIGKIDPEMLREAAPEADGRPLYFLTGVTGNLRGELLQYQGFKYSVGDATFAFEPAAPGAGAR